MDCRRGEEEEPIRRHKKRRERERKNRGSSFVDSFSSSPFPSLRGGVGVDGHLLHSHRLQKKCDDGSGGRKQRKRERHSGELACLLACFLALVSDSEFESRLDEFMVLG